MHRCRPGSQGLPLAAPRPPSERTCGECPDPLRQPGPPSLPPPVPRPDWDPGAPNSRDLVSPKRIRPFLLPLPSKVAPRPVCLKLGQDKVIGGRVQTPKRPTSSSHRHLLHRLFRSFSLHVVPYRIRVFFSLFPRRPARPLWCLRTPLPAIPCPPLDAGEPQIPPSGADLVLCLIPSRDPVISPSSCLASGRGIPVLF